METIIEQLFKSLDGKKARVSSGGLCAEGSVEGSVYLRYIQYKGLRLIAEAKWNNALELNKTIYDFIRGSELDFESKDKLYDLLESSKLVDNAKVTVGLVSQYGIKNFKTYVSDKDDITYLKLKYEDSTVEVQIVK